MFQKPCKTLNFMKIIVCKIPPGGGGSETISVQRPIGYSLFEDHRSVPSFGPGFFCLNSVLRKINSV